MSSGKCDLCKEYGQRCNMAGGLPAILCVRHHREWDAYCRPHEAFAKLRAAEVQYEVFLAALAGGAITPESVQTAIESGLDRIVAANEMYAVAQAWLTRRVCAPNAEGKQDED